MLMWNGSEPVDGPNERRLCYGHLLASHQKSGSSSGYNSAGQKMAAMEVDPFQIGVHGQSPLVRMHVVDQPNVNENASTSGPKNSISNWRSAIGPGCRMSW
jgi:hypothetical protein